MALYARIENGAAVEKREFASPPPAHKNFWKPVVDPGPPALAAGEVANASEAESGGNWVVSYIKARLSDAELKAGIKREAQRRIIALTGTSDLSTCLTKQVNAMMRATELTNKKATGQTLTAQEQAEEVALQALADSIKAIRSKSDALEVALPVNFTDNAHW